MSGYVRIHRPLFEDHPAFRNDAEAMAFAWLIVKAAWKPAKVRYKGHILFLTRGQAAVSVRDFATAMDRDKAWIERLLKRLKAETMIETRNEAGVNVITICNYDEYQADIGTAETARETPRETEARQLQDTEQGREEGKNSSEANASSQRAKFPAPLGVSAEQWKAFRQQRKKPLNDHAYRLLCNKLSGLAEDGYPPGEMIDLAIERGWETVFKPKDHRHVGSIQRNRTSNPTLELYRASIGAEPAYPANSDGAWPALPPARHG